MTKLQKILIVFVFMGLLSAAFHALNMTHVLPRSIVYSDIVPFSKRALSDGWIYIDKTIEYPVLIGNVVSFAGKAGRTVPGYYLINALLLIVAGAVTTYYLYRMLPDEEKKNLWTYWVLAPSIFLFTVYNWDIFSVCFVVLAFYMMKKQKDLWASFFLALGFLSKLYPVFFLVPLLMKQQTSKARIETVLVFLRVVIAANIFFAVKNFQAWWFFFRFSSERVADNGSLWKILIPLFQPWLYDVQTLNYLSLFLFVLSAGYLLWRYKDATVIQLCFWITILFLLFNKVFSPQFILWLLPFFVLLNWRKKIWYYGFEISTAALLFAALFYVFPPNYPLAGNLIILFTILRLFFLVAILTISIKEYEREAALNTSNP